MYYIKKMRADHVIDHAAEELKKYLRMMMPDNGDVAIVYEPGATDGFRLGLLEDFGLPSEAEDPRLDDVIHIDTDEKGGILAGSNPRSVLYAVYRMLRENGCRWLYPGVDGDYIPMKEIEPVKYHKMADHRFRGFCNEGTESQQVMLEVADYYAKLEMNVYMLEFFVPASYYDRHYNHTFNEANRKPEPVPRSQILQWKRQCESEISKRGLMFHDIGHGWTAKPFGIYDLPSNTDVNTLPKETVDCLALLNGKRDFFEGESWKTNLCMSKPHVRTRMAEAVADYAETHSNSDYLHVWLSDGSHNHCECEECRKKHPSDWYVMMLNELDEILTARKLETRIVFIAYVDTLWGAEEQVIKNPERFSLLYAPVTRSYTNSLNENSVIPEPPAFVHNAWKAPRSAEENLAILHTWKKAFQGPIFSYEYHFWRHQYLDPGGMAIARRLYEDVRGLRYGGIDGYVEDGSQRSGFPNAFPVYIYAETLMNRDCDYEAVKADYFSHIYGEDWKEAVDLLQQMTDAFDFAYMQGDKGMEGGLYPHHNPAMVESFQKVFEICKKERELADAHSVMPTRPQTVSWRMLDFHAEFCEEFAKFFIEICQANVQEGIKIMETFCPQLGKREMEFERYYDHCLACRSLERLLRAPKKAVILE